MPYFLLGIIQGLTEFLPVSSSGHLVLFSHFLNFEKSQILAYVVVCHFGTLFAIFCFFIKDIRRILKDMVLLWQIALITLISAIIGLLGRSFFEGLFKNPKLVCLALFIMAIFLFLTRLFSSGRRNLLSLNIKDVLLFGIAQGFAIIPGISRSGMTIISLLARGIEPEAAFRFSFIAGIPAILGAYLLEAKKVEVVFNNNITGFWLSLCFSFLAGLIGLIILKTVVKRMHLDYFGYYLMVVSIIGFIFIKGA